MARILVAGADDGLARRSTLTRLVSRLRSDGHDAVLHRDAEEGPVEAVREADAVVVVLDGADAQTGAAVAYADALHKPILGLSTPGIDAAAFLDAACTRRAAGDDIAVWLEALPAFYEDVKPFAGRLVRDLVPRLVKEAGHDVVFREVPDEDRPRFLKNKVAEEARELARADRGQEKEEVADVLEALETLLAVRGYSREELKAVKDGKKKRRGGFEKCFVVESTARDAAEPAPRPAPASTAKAAPEERAAPAKAPADGSTPRKAKAIGQTRTGHGSSEVAPDADEVKGTKDREVSPRLFEL